MKILHVCETLAGGPASHLEEIIPYQIEKYGIGSVRVLFPSSHEKYFPALSSEIGIVFNSNGRSIRSLISLTEIYLKTIRMYKPDVVHIHSTWAGFAIRSAPVRRSAKIVYCPHGWSFAMEVNAAQRMFFSFVERLLMHKTDAVVNVSHYEKMIAIQAGLNPLKQHVISNGIQNKKLEFNGRKYFSDDKINYIFIGRLDRQKGIDYLLKEVENLDSETYHFHIFGSEIVGKKQLKQREAHNVTFYGWTARERIMEILRDADGIVMPSRWEGLPITALEAMRAGKAIIASDRSCFPEIVEDGISGALFEMDVPGALRKCIAPLTRVELHKMGVAARVRFEQEFTADKQAQKIMELYEQLTGRAAI